MMDGDTDPEVAMRETMGFSNFNTSGHKGKGKETEGMSISGSDRSRDPSRARHAPQESATKHLAASGSNRVPLANEENRHFPKRTKMDDSSTMSTPTFRPTIPASLTPASILPPKPPVTVYSKNDVRSDPMYNPDIARQESTNTDPTAVLDTSAEPRDEDQSAQTAPFQHHQRTTRPPTKRTNERGDTVYFKPSFIEVDPWARTRVVLAKRAQVEASGSGRR